MPWQKPVPRAVKIPVIYKVTPQCVNQAAVSTAVKEGGCAAITANNALYGTFIDHETGTFYGGPYAVGGLIGRSWQLFSLAKLLETTATIKGFPVIGVGGIFTWDDCVRYLMAGAGLTGPLLGGIQPGYRSSEGCHRGPRRLYGP